MYKNEMLSIMLCYLWDQNWIIVCSILMMVIYKLECERALKIVTKT